MGDTFVHMNQSVKFTIKEKAISNDKKDVGYIYHESVMDIVIPFLLVQLSFIDIFYFQVMLNHWKEIINNPYFFPTRKTKTQLDKKFAGLSD